MQEQQLELLLEKRKKYIGQRAIATSNFSIAFTLLLADLTATFHDIIVFGVQIKGNNIRAFSVFIMLVCFLLALYRLFFRKYSHRELLKEIKELSIIKKEYRSIAVIQDSFNVYSHRFLVYYDTIWHCWLCPHFPTKDTVLPTIDEIKKNVSNELNIAVKHISVTYVCDQDEHLKRSLRINEDKMYHFFYFKVVIDFNPKWAVTNDTFKIHDKEFAWKSISELRNDNTTMTSNSDVVNFLESHQW